ncbi:MAG: hypothetical protein RL183_1032 [Pseudomonadota bacterium]|jgi:uncharacterized SAM-binding protein YcdF (DUF218 family)
MQTWTLDWAFRNLIAELLMPPGIWIISLLLVFLLFRKKPLLQAMTVIVSALIIWVTSTSVFAEFMVRSLDPLIKWPTPIVLSNLPSHPTLKQRSDQDLTQAQTRTKRQIQNYSEHPQAIVVLGGGRRLGAQDSSEYSHQDLGKESLERVRLAAKVAKQTGLPILTTGGLPDARGESQSIDQAEAAIMALVLKNEYGLSVKWIEDQSHTTQENAVYSAKLLKPEGVDHIYLVTQFWHMPRAQKIFEKQGFKVFPIEQGYQASQRYTPLDFYPSAQGMTLTRQIWHESLGAVWYAIRY